MSSSPADSPSRATITKFRVLVEQVADPWHRYVLSYFYLTAARANEGCGIMPPSDRNQKTEAIGPKRRDVEYDSLDGAEVMKVSFGTLKRSGRPERIVALPLKSCEPWADYLARNFEKLSESEPLVPFPRQYVNGVYRRYGLNERSNSGTASRKNPLRHIRINHLIDYYGFSPFQITLYAGWSLASSSVGLGGSPTITEYASQMWREYFPKLLKPLPVGRPA